MITKGRNFFTGLVFGGVMVILGLSLISCEDVTGFFSHSWGEDLKRDPSKLVGDVKPSNVKDMVKTFAGDPEASKALLKEISKKAQAATGKDKAILQSAGLAAAANASGLGTTILSSAGDFLSDNDEEAIDKLTNMLDDFPNVTAIADDLVTLFGEPGSDNIYPHIDPDAGNDLVMAAVICLLADYQDKNSEGGDLESYINNFSDNVDPDQVSDSFSSRQKTAYYLLKTAKKNGAEGVLGDLLKEFHF
jgi:hypothetical protein